MMRVYGFQQLNGLATGLQPARPVLAPTRLLKHLGRAPELLAAGRHTRTPGQLVKRYLDIGHVAYPFHMPLAAGGSLTLSSPAEVRVFWQIFIHGSYRLPARCDTILDCGANVGIFSIWAARQLPHATIVALEPFPDTFAALESNIARNQYERRVRCTRLGLAATTGERLINTAGESPTRALVLSDVTDATADTLAIRTITLENCLQIHGLETVDLVKMDIEGSEWEVLLSTPVGVLRRIRNLQLEYHEVNARFGYSPEQLFAHLEKAGHQLTFRKEDEYRTGMAYFEKRN